MLSRDSFTTIYLALLAMLWAELEELLLAIESSNHSDERWPIQAQAEALLLETTLLRECCDKRSVHAALPCAERMRLLALMTELLDLLELEPMQLPNPAACATIIQTQNRIFHEVHLLAVGDPHSGTDGSFMSEAEVDTFLQHRHAAEHRSRDDLRHSAFVAAQESA